LKKATPTPNRFIISTRSWPVKGLPLFLILLALGSCQDEIGLIGTNNRTSRFGVYFKEFDIPVTTVQTDSIVSTALVSERLLCGTAQDPNFGKSTAMFFTQFRPTLSNINKIDKTNKSNFQVIGVEMVMVLGDDYYVYGDTSNAQLTYAVHRITDPSYWISKENYTTSTLQFNPTAISSGTFNYLHDSIVKHRKLNTNTSGADDVYDTLAFQLPYAYGQQLLDSALAKGVYSFNSENEWDYDEVKTDSVFRIAFPGLAFKATGVSNRIMGFKSELGLTIQRTSRIILKYSYIKDGSTIFDELLYFNSTAVDNAGLGFTNVMVDRSGTALADLDHQDPTDRNIDFHAPDQFCYMQSGTGLYAKLDFSGLHSYFDGNPDTIANVAINAAEIVLEAEPDASRHHLSQPQALYLRVVKQSNGFFRTPIILRTVDGKVEQALDESYSVNYNCIANGLYLDARNDEAGRLSIPLKSTSDTQPQFYSAYLSDFIQYFLRVPDGFPKIYNVGLVPAPTPFGKSFEGFSFKKDKVKLRIYYTKTL
jgi:hypothetical protein